VKQSRAFNLISLLAVGYIVALSSCCHYQLNSISISNNIETKKGIWIEPSSGDSVSFFMYNYVGGKKNGIAQVFLKNQTKIIGHYKNDKKIDEWKFSKNNMIYRKEFYTDNFMYKIEFFENGKKVKTIICDPSW